MAKGDCEFATWSMVSFTTSIKEIDDTDWFALDFRRYGKTFTISVSKKDLHNSNTLEADFDAIYSMLSSETSREPAPSSDDDDIDDVDQSSPTGMKIDDQRSGKKCPHESSSSEMTIHDCFAWAMKPCSTAVERLAPRPTIEPGDKITLEYFFGLDRYETQLSAVQDGFLEPDFQRSQDFVYNDFSDSPQVDGRNWKSKTTFPVFSKGEVEVIPGPDGLEHFLLYTPTHVRVHERQLYFKHVGEYQDLAIMEVDKYEKMKRANFPADVRTSRLYGIVEDEKEEILGLLYEDLGREVFPLDFEEVMSPQTPEEYKRRWISQIRRAVQALHNAGIIWGDTKAGNILVDKNGKGDAWFIDFGGGYTEGWVDREKSNTFEGDLQGLARIIDYVETGQRT